MNHVLDKTPHPPTRALSLETLGMTMRFGNFTALRDVRSRCPPAPSMCCWRNGAGKSTLVKCIMGFYQPTSGQLTVDGREVEVAHPRAAHDLGLGMVYQHFTLVPRLPPPKISSSAAPTCQPRSIGDRSERGFPPSWRPCPSRCRSMSRSDALPPARSRSSNC